MSLPLNVRTHRYVAQVQYGVEYAGTVAFDDWNGVIKIPYRLKFNVPVGELHRVHPKTLEESKEIIDLQVENSAGVSIQLTNEEHCVLMSGLLPLVLKLYRQVEQRPSAEAWVRPSISDISYASCSVKLLEILRARFT